jgi:hypothetical protein
MGKLGSKLKQVLCFQDAQKKLMYRHHVKEKEARAHQIKMMHHLAMEDVQSGSEKVISPEEKWVKENFQWTDGSQFVSADDLEGDTSHAMESPPHADSVDESSEEEEEPEHDDEDDSEWSLG